MIIDFLLAMVFFVSLWIGWSLRIYIHWLRLLVVIIFACLIWLITPFFLDFVEHSSAEISPGVFIGFGIGLAVLIFLCFYTLIKGKKTSSGFRRFAGSMTLALLSLYSLMIILSTLSSYGWVNVTESILFTEIPEWLLEPGK